MLRVLLPFLFVTAVLGTYGGGSYAEYDCGGSCGGGCSQSGSYSSPCGGGQAAPVVQYESSSSGCDSGDCGNYGGGSSSRYSSGRAASSGYHKTVTTVTKETRNDHLKIVVGKPVVHRTTYVQPAPQPQVVYKKQRYVDEGSNYGGGDYDCGGPCGGGSKIVKIIKKTTYSGGDGGVCMTCDYSGGGGGGGASYSSNIEYSQPIVHKVTRIITQPKVVRVIKTSVVAPVETSGEYYEDSGSSGCGGGGCGGRGGGYTSKRYTSGGSGGSGYGGGGGRSKAFAFASASASAGAGAGGGSSGDYTEGGGCKSGCDQWKK